MGSQSHQWNSQTVSTGNKQSFMIFLQRLTVLLVSLCRSNSSPNALRRRPYLPLSTHLAGMFTLRSQKELTWPWISLRYIIIVRTSLTPQVMRGKSSCEIITARYWEDPKEFKPSRFLQEWDRDAFLPFSMGSRSCLGRRYDLCFHLLYNFWTIVADLRSSSSLQLSVASYCGIK